MNGLNGEPNLGGGPSDLATIQVEDATAGYGEKVILHDVSMIADEGEVITLIGPNGAGKSTLLKTIAGIVIPNSGRVTHGGVDTTTMTPDERLKRGIAFIPQGRSVFSNMSIEENLLMGGYVFNDETTRERMRDVFKLFPILKDRREARATTLSGGQQQMLELGRGLIAAPDVLLIDEPSLGLAPDLVKDMLETVRDLADDGICVIMVEQNVYDALDVSDRAYVLADGQIQFHDDASTVAANERMGELYLGGNSTT